MVMAAQYGTPWLTSLKVADGADVKKQIINFAEHSGVHQSNNYSIALTAPPFSKWRKIWI